MLKLFLKWIVFSLIIMFIAWIIPGIEVENFWTAMIVSIVIALINAFIKPLLKIISLPINIMTLGIFSLVINAVLFMFAGYLTPGFEVNGFLNALFGSILLAIFSVAVKNI